MRTLLIILTLLAFTGPLSQAQDEPYETIFQRKANRQTSVWKGYGAVLTEFSPSFGNANIRSFLSNGLEAGLIAHRRL